MLSETLRSQWFSGCVHAAMWLLLLLILTGIGGKQPRFRESSHDPSSVTSPVPVAKLESLFAASNHTNLLSTAAGDDGSWVKGRNPFVTSYFMPRTVPPPPSPTTKRIELTYQGFYQTGDGPKHALIRFGNALVVVPAGGSVATNLFVASATATNLMLTNSTSTGQTHVLVLNTKKEIEIPIQ